MKHKYELWVFVEILGEQHEVPLMVSQGVDDPCIAEAIESFNMPCPMTYTLVEV